MQARLKVLHQKANGKQVKLLATTVIGRGTECDLKIASSDVSRVHCRITMTEESVFIEDLGSTNGTLVNDQLLIPHQRTAVDPGIKLTIGPAEFVLDYVASGSNTVVIRRTADGASPKGPAKVEVQDQDLITSVHTIDVQEPDETPIVVYGKGDSVSSASMPVMADPPLKARVVPQFAAVAPTNLPVTSPIAPAKKPVAAKSTPPQVVVVIPASPRLGEQKAAQGANESMALTLPALMPTACSVSAPSGSGDQIKPPEEVNEFKDFNFSENVAKLNSGKTPPKSEKSSGLKSMFPVFGQKAIAATSSTISNKTPVLNPSPSPADSVEPLNFEMASSDQSAEVPKDLVDPPLADDFQNFLRQL